jgi:hypothetical protein
MTTQVLAQVLERPRRRSAPARSHFTLRHEEAGWTLLQPDGRARQFATFEAGIDGVREAAPARKTPIDVWQDGQYICCLPPEQWPHSATAAPKPLFPATERYANRAARWLMPMAGTFFWLALVIVALAAGLGSKLALL